MRRSLGLSMAAAIALAAVGPAAAGAMAAVAPSLPSPTPPRRRAVATQPETPVNALRREIAAHNATVDARRAEKLARRGTNRKG